MNFKRGEPGLFLIAALVLFSGCLAGDDGTPDPGSGINGEDNLPVHIMVSNQQPDRDPVRIKVTLGDELLVDKIHGYDASGSPWSMTTMNVTGGEHTLVAESVECDSIIVQKVDVDRELWLIIRCLSDGLELEIIHDDPGLI